MKVDRWQNSMIYSVLDILTCLLFTCIDTDVHREGAMFRLSKIFMRNRKTACIVEAM